MIHGCLEKWNLSSSVQLVRYQVQPLKRNSVSLHAHVLYSRFLTISNGEVNKNGKGTLCGAHLNQHATDRFLSVACEQAL